MLVAVAGPGALTFAVLVGLLFVSGLGSSWVIPLNVSFVQAVPSAYRGRAFGVAVSGLYGVQGIGALAAGLAAEGVAAQRRDGALRWSRPARRRPAAARRTGVRRAHVARGPAG